MWVILSFEVLGCTKTDTGKLKFSNVEIATLDYDGKMSKDHKNGVAAGCTVEKNIVILNSNKKNFLVD